MQRPLPYAYDVIDLMRETIKLSHKADKPSRAQKASGHINTESRNEKRNSGIIARFLSKVVPKSVVPKTVVPKSIVPKIVEPVSRIGVIFHKLKPTAGKSKPHEVEPAETGPPCRNKPDVLPKCPHGVKSPEQKEQNKPETLHTSPPYIEEMRTDSVSNLQQPSSSAENVQSVILVEEKDSTPPLKTLLDSASQETRANEAVSQEQSQVDSEASSSSLSSSSSSEMSAHGATGEPWGMGYPMYDAVYWGNLRTLEKSRITNLVSRLISGNPDQSNDYEVIDQKQGAFHVVYIVQSSMGTKVCLKIPATGQEGRWDKNEAKLLRSEALTMRYIKKKTKVPIPTVFAYDTNMDNEVTAPFILMSFIEGKPFFQTSNDWINENVYEDRIKVFYDSLARSMAELSSLKFKEVGMLEFPDEDGDPIVGPLSTFYWLNRWNTPDISQLDTNIKKGWISSGPYSSSAQYFASLLRVLWNRGWGGDYAGVRELLKLCAACVPLSLDNESSHELFGLAHPDFAVQNVLCGPDGNVTGLIDWENVQTAPIYLGYAAFPLWLREDWQSGYNWPYDNSISSPIQLAEDRAVYSTFLRKHLGQSGDWVYPESSVALMALVESLQDADPLQGGREFTNRILHLALPTINPNTFYSRLADYENGGWRKDPEVDLKLYLEKEVKEIFRYDAILDLISSDDESEEEEISDQVASQELSSMPETGIPYKTYARERQDIPVEDFVFTVENRHDSKIEDHAHKTDCTSHALDLQTGADEADLLIQGTVIDWNGEAKNEAGEALPAADGLPDEVAKEASVEVDPASTKVAVRGDYAAHNQAFGTLILATPEPLVKLPDRDDDSNLTGLSTDGEPGIHLAFNTRIDVNNESPPETSADLMATQLFKNHQLNDLITIAEMARLRAEKEGAVIAGELQAKGNLHAERHALGNVLAGNPYKENNVQSKPFDTVARSGLVSIGLLDSVKENIEGLASAEYQIGKQEMEELFLQGDERDPKDVAAEHE